VFTARSTSDLRSLTRAVLGCPHRSLTPPRGVIRLTHWQSFAPRGRRPNSKLAVMRIHNRFLPSVVHRGFNALVGGSILVLVAMLGLTSLSPQSWLWEAPWVVLFAAAPVSVVLLFVNPDRFSLVQGVAGADGYDELP